LTEHSLPERGDLPQAEAEGGAIPQSVADATFCEELAEYLGIKPSTAKTAFLDEPAQRVLGVASWAMDKSEDPEERARMVIAWAKKRGAGAFRPVPDEYISLAGSVGRAEEAHRRENETLARLLARYWHENPRRLARVLDELEIWVNVFPERLEREDGRS
jgi:predicted secreted protein